MTKFNKCKTKLEYVDLLHHETELNLNIKLCWFAGNMDEGSNEVGQNNHLLE